MFIIGLLLLGGVTWLAVDRAGIAILGLAVVGLLLWGWLYIDYYTGSTSLIIGSWQFLSGAPTPDALFNHHVCTYQETSSASKLYWLPLIKSVLLLVGGLLILIPGLIALIATPVGIVGTVVGGVVDLVRRELMLFPQALAIFVVAMGAIIASGLMFRLLGAIDALGSC